MESKKTSYPRKNQLKEAEEIPHLPNEIIEQILRHLPVEDLLRFRCVSKSWRALISSPQFVKSHLKTSSSSKDLARHGIIFHGFHKSLERVSTLAVLCQRARFGANFNSSSFYVEESVRVVGSCNGLICVLIGGEKFILWNPATRKFKYLPDVEDDSLKKNVDGYGFGFDESNDDYKVFAARFISADKVFAEMYSSKGDSWKIIIPVTGYFSKHAPSISVTGKLYWGPTTTDDYSRNIVFFDLENEVFGEVKHPHQDSKGKGYFYFMTLCVCDGCFCIYYYFPNHHFPDKHRGEAWVLKGHGPEIYWEKAFSISYAEYPLRNFEPSRFCFVFNGEVLLLHGLDYVVYSLLDRSFRLLPGRHGSRGYEEVFYVCTETVVSLDGEQEMSILEGDYTYEDDWEKQLWW